MPSRSPTAIRRTGRLRRVGLSVVAVTALATGASAGGPVAPPPPYADALQPELDQLAEQQLVTGAVVLVRSAEHGDWTYAIGDRTRDGGDPVQVGDHVRVGSNTKTWTGTVILQLAQEGRLTLDDPVSTHLADVPGGENITIGQLLSMRSGLANYTEDFDLNNQNDIYPTKAWKPDELLAKAYAMEAVAPPGSAFHYTNTNFILLGRIIEELTGRPVAEEFQDRLFAPLGMEHTELPDITSSGITDPHAHGYTYGTNVGTIESLVLPPDVQEAARSGEITPMDVTYVNPSWAWTAGSGISTAEDLARWVEGLAVGELLSPDLQKQRLDSPQPTDPDDPGGASYGLALAKFGALYGHTGELPGYNSFIGHDPDRDITIVTWAVPAPSVDGKAPAVELAKTVIAELYG